MKTPPMSLPVGADEVAYDLSGNPVLVRAAATDDLEEHEIPYRWEDDLVLVVPASAEGHVDELLDDLTGEPG